VALECPRGVTRLWAEDARAMQALVLEQPADIFIATAAVADYRPRQVAAAKIKKEAATLTLELERNPDILAAVAARPGAPFCVGFAAETHDLAAQACKKRLSKGLDLVAANWVGAPGQGFDSDDNALELFWEGGQQSLARGPKTRLARQLIEIIARLYREKHPTMAGQDLHAQDSA
jgi:phosphopantothenoylcysteine decarboxylase/phosphopantothenate--cysteine ligase